MINLNDFIVEIDGKKYIPLEVAQTAQTEGVNPILDTVKKAIDEINNSVNDALKDD